MSVSLLLCTPDGRCVECATDADAPLGADAVLACAHTLLATHPPTEGQNAPPVCFVHADSGVLLDPARTCREHGLEDATVLHVWLAAYLDAAMCHHRVTTKTPSDDNHTRCLPREQYGCVLHIGDPALAPLWSAAGDECDAGGYPHAPPHPVVVCHEHGSAHPGYTTLCALVTQCASGPRPLMDALPRLGTPDCDEHNLRILRVSAPLLGVVATYEQQEDGAAVDAATIVAMVDRICDVYTALALLVPVAGVGATRLVPSEPAERLSVQPRCFTAGTSTQCELVPKAPAERLSAQSNLLGSVHPWVTHLRTWLHRVLASALFMWPGDPTDEQVAALGAVLPRVAAHQELCAGVAEHFGDFAHSPGVLDACVEALTPHLRTLTIHPGFPWLEQCRNLRTLRVLGTYHTPAADVQRIPRATLEGLEMLELDVRNPHKALHPGLSLSNLHRLVLPTNPMPLLRAHPFAALRHLELQCVSAQLAHIPHANMPQLHTLTLHSEQNRTRKVVLHTKWLAGWLLRHLVVHGGFQQCTVVMDAALPHLERLHVSANCVLFCGPDTCGSGDGVARHKGQSPDPGCVGVRDPSTSAPASHLAPPETANDSTTALFPRLATAKLHCIYGWGDLVPLLRAAPLLRALDVDLGHNVNTFGCLDTGADVGRLRHLHRLRVRPCVDHAHHNVARFVRALLDVCDTPCPGDTLGAARNAAAHPLVLRMHHTHADTVKCLADLCHSVPVWRLRVLHVRINTDAADCAVDALADLAHTQPNLARATCTGVNVDIVYRINPRRRA